MMGSRRKQGEKAVFDHPAFFSANMTPPVFSFDGYLNWKEIGTISILQILGISIVILLYSDNPETSEARR
jgi:hypothetical protein